MEHTTPVHHVKINKSVLATLKKLTVISPKMVFKREGDMVVLRTKGQTVATQFKTPAENFDFLGEEVAFVDFKNFVEHIESYKEEGREVTQDTVGNFYIKSGRSELKYRTSDSKILRKNAFDEIRDASPILVEFILTKGDLKTIASSCSKVKPDEIRINFSEDGTTQINIINTKTYTMFSLELEVKARTFEVRKVILNPDIFQSIPESDYEVAISRIGRCDFYTNDQDCDIHFYTGMKEKMDAPRKLDLEIEEEPTNA